MDYAMPAVVGIASFSDSGHQTFNPVLINRLYHKNRSLSVSGSTCLFGPEDCHEHDGVSEFMPGRYRQSSLLYSFL